VPELNGRRIDWPRGKVVGGSGAINGMVYARGLASDFDGWGQLGLLEWTWDRVRPYFERAEGGEGGGLALGLSQTDWWHPLYDAYLSAAESAGLGRAADLNAPEAEGAGRYSFMIEHGHRASTARRYLDPVRRNPNLRLYDRALVRTLTFDGQRCTGVTIERGGRIETIAAKRQVVLSAGTVGSPHILMLSGIGDAHHLSEIGIDVVADRPAVGQNLHDHLLVRVEHASLKPGPLGPLLRVDRAMLAVADAYLRGRGPAATFPLLVGGYFRSEPQLDRPDLQSHFLPALSSATLRINPFSSLIGAPTQDGFFANVSQMRPESRGAIRLASADPHQPPRIAPRHLSTQRDVLAMRGGVRVLRRLFAQDAFAPWRGPELEPGSDVVTDDEVDAWVQETAGTMFHPVGTCRMGVDADSVTDAALKVRGVEGLRVVDASVMPSITSANTQAPTIMIAEKAADLIGRY
jgi:choline dehydrogenase